MREETLGSAITCLVACLRGSTSSDVLNETLSTIKTVVQKDISQTVEMSLYEAVSRFIEDIVERKEQNDASGKNMDSNSGPIPIGGDPNGTKFLHDLILAVFGEPESSTPSSVAEVHESLRTARISLAAKFVSQPMLSLASRNLLESKLRSWYEQERSRPLRLRIGKALDVDGASRSH